MRTALAMMLAYLATTLVVPVLFVGMKSVVPVPLPHGVLFGPIFGIYLTTVLLAFVSGLPGFAIGRLTLWWIGAKSRLAFVSSGALAGYIAAAMLCLPNQLWALRTYDIDLFGAVLGAVSGLIYWYAERILSRATSADSKSREFGEETS